MFQTLNALDIVILFSFMAIIGVGFFNGITRVTAAIFAIYFGAIFAAAFYRPTSGITRNHIVSMGETTAEMAAFVILFFAFSAVFTVMISRWFGDLQLPRRITILDNIGGAALGIVVSGLALTLAAMMISIVLQALNHVAVGGAGPVTGFIRSEIRESALMPVFLRMAPFFLRMIAPWFPGGLPPILDGVARG